MYKKAYVDYNTQKVIFANLDSLSEDEYHTETKNFAKKNPDLAQVIFNESIMIRLLKHYYIGLKYEISRLEIDSRGVAEDCSNLINSLDKDRAYFFLLLEKIGHIELTRDKSLLEIELSNEERKITLSINGVVKYNEYSVNDVAEASEVIENYLFEYC